MARLTREEKAAQRIPFGERGIKDGLGRVIRTDHMNMKDALSNMIDGSPSRQDFIDARIAKAVDGIKAGQDRLAGIKRRKN